MDHPTPDDVIHALSHVNELLGTRMLDKKRRASDLLEKLAPHVNTAGRDAHASYIAAKQHLSNSSSPLACPMTGKRIDV